MFSCKRAGQREALEAAGASGLTDRLLVRMHLCVCGTCRRQFAQLRILDRACARLGGQCLLPPEAMDATLSAEARGRILRAVGEAATGGE